MLIFCNGMPRSASTWSYNVVLQLLRRANIGAVNGGYDENLHRFSQTMPSGAAHVVLKCHSLDPTGLMLVQVGAAKVVFTWRDPVDAVASFMTMFKTDFEQSLRAISDSIDLYHFHRRHGGLTLSYEEVVEQPTVCIDRIARYFYIQMDGSLACEIAQANSLGKMKEKVQEIGSLDYGPRLVRRDRGLYDPETLLNVDHIHHGGYGYGKSVLSDVQLNRIAEVVDRKGNLI
jgi:hypothetical protein